LVEYVTNFVFLFQLKSLLALPGPLVGRRLCEITYWFLCDQQPNNNHSDNKQPKQATTTRATRLTNNCKFVGRTLLIWPLRTFFTNNPPPLKVTTST